MKDYALKGLAENYTFQNEHEKALEILNRTNLKTNAIGDLLLNEGVYKLLAQNYLSIGDFDQYLQNNEIHKKILFERQQSELKSINSLIGNLEEKLTSELSALTKKHIIINAFLIFTTLLLSFIVLRKAFVKNRKNNEGSRKLEKLLSEKMK